MKVLSLIALFQRLSLWGNQTPRRKKVLDWIFPVWLILAAAAGTFMVSEAVLENAVVVSIVNLGTKVFPWLNSIKDWGDAGKKPLFLLCVFHLTGWLPVILSFSTSLSPKKIREKTLEFIVLGVVGLASIIWCIEHMQNLDKLNQIASWTTGEYTSAITTAMISMGIWSGILFLFLGASVLIEDARFYFDRYL